MQTRKVVDYQEHFSMRADWGRASRLRAAGPEWASIHAQAVLGGIFVDLATAGFAQVAAAAQTVVDLEMGMGTAAEELVVEEVQAVTAAILDDPGRRQQAGVEAPALVRIQAVAGHV